MNTVLNWSSGKDAALAYYLLQQQQAYEVTHLLTTISTQQGRITMHGVREELLDMQAERIGLPLGKIYLPPSPGDDLYKDVMRKALDELKADGVQASAFGDIFLEDLRSYREEQLTQAGMQAVFPLWKQDTRALINELGRHGIEAMVVCVNDKLLGKEMLGRKVDEQFLADLPAGVDPCGENGEFHTFVYSAPYFSAPINIRKGDIVHRSYAALDGNAAWNTGFYFLDITPI